VRSSQNMPHNVVVSKTASGIVFFACVLSWVLIF